MNIILSIPQWLMSGFIARLAGAGLLLLACSSLCQAQLMEGFENLANLKVAPGKATTVPGGEGVTEGKQACSIPAGSTLTLSVAAATLRQAAWLKIDTLGSDPVAYAMAIRVVTKDREIDRTAVARFQPGKDVLTLPLSVLAPGPADNAWPNGQITLTLTNRSNVSLILDNIRLAPAEPLPQGATFLDFGPPEQSVWPGATPGAPGDVHLIWSGSRTIYGLRPGFPDPLSGDFVGPYPSWQVSDHAEVASGDASSALAWVWTTHYATGMTWPMEYGVRTGSQVLAHKLIEAGRLLGADGVLRGMGGEWTPDWFDRTYAPTFCDVVRLDLPKGRAPLDVVNSQIAAMFIAPAAAKDAATAYVAMVQKDVSRYRRQFVLGNRYETICTVMPTDAEKQAGLMLFRGAASEFSPRWTPQEADRATTVRLLVPAGSEVRTTVAAVPVEDSARLAAVTGAFRDDRGKSLLLDATKTEAVFLRTVPCVADGEVTFQPWLTTPRLEGVKARTVNYMVICLSVRAEAQPGVYRGSLRITGPKGSLETPMELEVVDLAAAQKPEPLMTGGMGGLDAEAMFYSAAYFSPAAQQDMLTRRIRQSLMGDLLNGLMLTGPMMQSDMRLLLAGFKREVACYPQASATGWTGVNIRHACAVLSELGVAPGTTTYRDKITAIVSTAMNEFPAAAQARIGFFVGEADDADQLAARARVATEVRAAGGKAWVRIYASSLARISREERTRLMSQFDGCILATNTASAAAMIGELRKLRPEYVVFVFAWGGDRYSTGFFTCAADADGCWLGGAIGEAGGPYDGFNMNGLALLAPQPGGEFTRTMGWLQAAMGVGDRRIFATAEKLAAKARQDGTPAGELNKLLDEIRAKAAKTAITYNNNMPRNAAVATEQLEAWRESLIRASAAVSTAIKDAHAQAAGETTTAPAPK